MTAKSHILRNNTSNPTHSENPPHNTANRKRYLFIDIAKGIAIILVVIGHFYPDSSPFYYECIHRIIYTFHMPLFMMASGFLYIATRHEVSYLSFVRKKTLRLMIPYIATSIIILTIKLLTQGQMTVDHPVDLHSFIECLYLPAAGYFLWFLWALWIMFLIVYNFTTRSSRILLAGIALALYLCPIQFPNIFCLEQFRRMFIYFMGGIIFYDWKHYFSSLSINTFGCIITILFLFGEMAYIALGFNRYLEIILPWLGIATTLFVGMLIQKNKHSLIYRNIIRISSYSFFIYLFHTTFMGPAKGILMKLPFFINSSEISFLILAISIVTMGIIAPILTDRYLIRKSSVLSFIFGQKPIR